MEGTEKKYTFDEILLSKEFEAYIKGDNGEIKEFWDKVLENDVEARNEFEKALRLNGILSTAQNKKYPDAAKESLLKKILEGIKMQDKEYRSNAVIFNPYVLVAASFVLLVCLSFLINFLFFNSGTNKEEFIAYNEIIVPSGEKTQVVLPDGTKIWLNSESKLKYPTTFNTKSRNVYLEGEGYFDVAKNKGSKFLVNTQGVKIEVLGTIFNVKSYPNEETVETSVVEGKVKVDASTDDNRLKPIILLPVERAIYYKNIQKIATKSGKEKGIAFDVTVPHKNGLTIDTVNIKNIICWKDHLLVFDNETFEEIAVKMSRWYKIQVNIQDEVLKKQRFTGKFINNETFYQVLDAINLTTPIRYKYTENELFVSSTLHPKNGKKSNHQ